MVTSAQSSLKRAAPSEERQPSSDIQGKPLVKKAKLDFSRPLTDEFGQPDLVVREETLANERRTVITPNQLAELTNKGFKVALAEWSDRVFSKEDYIKAVQETGNAENFIIIKSEEWKKNDLCQYSLILGTKEIEDKKAGEEGFALDRRYIHFDHSYKNQKGAAKRIARFSMATEGGVIPQLLDHEYFVNATGKRTHAFGKSAGFATTAMSVLGWAQKTLGEDIKLDKYAYDTPEEFFEMTAKKLKDAIAKSEKMPKALILGSERGNSARGSKKFIEQLNRYLPDEQKIPLEMWGRQETTKRQEDAGLKGIEEYDIILNCTFTNDVCPPFMTDKTANANPDKIQIIGDVTCDTTADKNRMRFDKYVTTDFDDPAVSVGENSFAITIDHSPSLFPRKATEDMAEQFFTHLTKFLEDKRDCPELGGEGNTAARRSFERLRHVRSVSMHGIGKGNEIIKNNNVMDWDETKIQSYIAENKKEISNYINQSYQNDGDLEIAAYGMACGMLKLANPVGDPDPQALDHEKLKFYKAHDNPDAIDAKAEMLYKQIMECLEGKTSKIE